MSFRLQSLVRDLSSRRWIPWALLMVGVAFRIAVAFPAHKYAADGDCASHAICAFDVMRGEAPVFAVANRIGSLGCYLTALLFTVFGISRGALAAGPVIVGCLLLPVWYLFLRELLGRRRALIALPFIAVPSPAFVYWSYMPNSYPETLFLGGSMLWLAARIGRGDDSLLTCAALGASIGLGWWNSIQTLVCTGPALVWLLWRRPALLQNRRALASAAVGGVIGAAPWLAYNLRYPLASFRNNFSTQTTAGADALLENIGYLLTHRLPELVASAPGKISGPSLFTSGLQLPTLAIVVVSTLFVFLAPVAAIWRAPDREEWRSKLAPWMLFLLVFLAILAVNVFSFAGARRGLTVRYVLPLYLIVPGLLAVALHRGSALWRPLAGVLTAVVLTYNLAGAHLPGTASRRYWAEAAVADRELAKVLAQQQVEAVLGGFWKVYPVNFLSGGEVYGLPLEKRYDLRWVVKQLPATPLRWALLTESAEDLKPCLEITALAGATLRVNDHYSIWIPHEEPADSRAFLGRLRKSCLSQRRSGDAWIGSRPTGRPPPRRPPIKGE